MTTVNLPVLIVDDQPAVVQALRVLFDLHDIPNCSAASPDEAIAIASRSELGAVVQDMNFSRNETEGGEGERLFEALRELQPDLPVLLMTAWASLETAVRLVKAGAVDYIEKPWDDDKLVTAVRNLLRLRGLEIENRNLRADLVASRTKLAREHDLCGVIYASEAMHEVISLAVNVARSDAAVLISGPSGSGKEKLAEIVQANSRRSRGPFVKVNVGAIPQALAEAELFGAEPGAYTGLQGRRIGHFETADGGTLFLDEIDALAPAVQVKLLRVLQVGEFQRLGSSRTHRADVRIISATNTDLAEAIASGRLREDLMYRLNVVELEVPPLVDRRGDILLLAEHFLDRFSDTDEDSLERAFSAAARQALLAHDWPGNVRELENRIQRATVVADRERISAADLALDDSSTSRDPSAVGSWDDEEILERDRLMSVLARADGVVAHAAAELGISRQALYRKMARLGIEIERRPRQ